MLAYSQNISAMITPLSQMSYSSEHVNRMPYGGEERGGATTIHVMVIYDLVHAYPDAVTIMYH